MKKYLIKLTTLLTVLSLCAGLATPAFATDVVHVQNIMEEVTDLEEVNVQLIYDYVTSINNNDWETWASLYTDAVRDEYTSFVAAKAQTGENPGILTVSSASVDTITPVSNDWAPKGIYSELDGIFQEPDNVDCYIVSIDMTVREDNGYFHDGINSMVIILVNENGQWGVGATYNGPDITSENATIWKPGSGTLRDFIQADDSTRPSTVNIQYLKADGTLDVCSTSLGEYVKNTVQNECGNLGYNTEALKALCVTSLSHVWFFCLSKYYNSRGFDIRSDDSTVNYHPGTVINDSISQAYSQISGYFIVANDSVGSNLHFSTPYNGFCSTNSGRGQMNESKANALAKEGNSWYQIIHYFFDNSQYNVDTNVGVVRIKYY